MNKKLKLGMIGGGKGSFIGPVHRMAAMLDNQFELVCGAFSSNPDISIETGKELNLDKKRVYNSFETMFKQETQLPANEKIDAVAIVTPNNLHFEPAKLALENGFHVIIDKPMTYNLDEALKLEKLVTQSGLIFALTHTYTGYPMVKEAREIIKSGKLGNIRKVIVEYPQGWLYKKIEDTGQKQAGWRTDPAQAGVSCTMGDIGVHAMNLAEYISGLEITELCADISSFVEGRNLDDDGNVLLRFNNGANGLLFASQVCTGEENDLRIRVYGEAGGLDWRQMEPNSLILKWPDQPIETMRTGTGYLSDTAKVHARVPAGHPEGYIEAFANIYRNFAMAIKNHKNGKKPDPLYDYPTVHDGVRGMKFIEKAIESGNSPDKWIRV